MTVHSSPSSSHLNRRFAGDFDYQLHRCNTRLSQRLITPVDAEFTPGMGQSNRVPTAGLWVQFHAVAHANPLNPHLASRPPRQPAHSHDLSPSPTTRCQKIVLWNGWCGPLLSLLQRAHGRTWTLYRVSHDKMGVRPVRTFHAVTRPFSLASPFYLFVCSPFFSTRAYPALCCTRQSWCRHYWRKTGGNT